MKRIIILLACLVIVLSEAQADKLFRWVDKKGRVHYGDVPPADIDDVEHKNLSSPASENEDLPYETRRAQENFPVTLFVASGCGTPCEQARSLLKNRGIPFSEKMLTTQQEIEEFYKTSGINSAPTLLVGKNYLSGFLESEWNSELDLAGYPKFASYRQRIAPPLKPPSPVLPPPESQAAPTAPATPPETAEPAEQ